MSSKRKWYFIRAVESGRSMSCLGKSNDSSWRLQWVFAAKDLQRHAQKPGLNPHAISGKIIVRLLCASAKGHMCDLL